MNGSTAEQPGNGDKHGIETTRAKGKVPHKEDTPGDVSAINNDVNLVENGIDNISNVNNPPSPSSAASSSDDYYLSDDDEILHSMVEGQPSTLSDHSAYISSTISNALDSIQLDKSLVVQAQLSGKLNNDNQKLIDKKNELREKLETLQDLYNKHFIVRDSKGLNNIEKYQIDLKDVVSRIETLKYGANGEHLKGGIMSLFKNQKSGVVQKYPIEYNQARDKVIERQVDE